jgi:tetratricopeptide (TPR) repeat protein
MEQWDEAVEHLSRAAESLPVRPRTFYNLGLLLQQIGRLEEAEVALRRAVEADPEDLDLLYALADHLARRGRLREALELTERMIGANPESRLGHDMKAAIERALAGQAGNE